MAFSPAQIAAAYNLKARSGRWAGPCPKCGGGKSSDKFVLREDGGFKCYGCDFKGDAITWLREMEGMSCPDAHEAADQPCRASMCPASDKCRLGDGKSKGPKPKKQALAPTEAPKAKKLPTAQTKSPAQVWQEWATALVESATPALLKNAEALTWLAGRGISQETAVLRRLGWIGRNCKVERAAIGLDPKDDKETLWIPAGLVIPTLDPAGNIHRLRIRRTDADRERFLPDLKYVWIEGSGTAPMVLPATKQARGHLIVEAELDAITCAAAHHEVTMIALGTVSAGMPDDLHRELQTTATILVALDADPGKEGKPGAGPKAIAAWCSQYRQAHYWPVPAGKDPGDYAQDPGANMHAWIEAGLLPKLAAPVAPKKTHDDEPIRLSDQKGGQGSNCPAPLESQPESQNGSQAPIKEPVRCTSGSGREFILVFTRGQFRRETENNPDVPVFGSTEIDRIAGIDPDGADKLLMMKGIFGGEIVYHGPVRAEECQEKATYDPSRQRRARGNN